MKLKNNIRTRLSFLLFYSLIICIVLAPIFSNDSLPNVIDYLTHMSAIIQAKMAIHEGQFPLRVAPVSHMGWYYPFYQFYSSSSYLLGGLYYQVLSPANPFTAYKLMLASAMMVSGLYMYRLAYSLVFSRKAALIASTIYLLSPYSIILVDRLGALNEAMALGVLPAVIFYTLKRLNHPEDDRTLLKMSIAWYVLATVHLITFIYSSLSVGLLTVFLAWHRENSFNRLLRVGIAYLLAVCLAAWFFAPLILLQKSLIAHLTFSNPGLFSLYIPKLLSVFYPLANTTAGLVGKNGYIDSMSQIHPNLGLPITLGLIGSIYLLSQYKRLLNTKQAIFLGSVTVIFGATLGLMCAPLKVWDALPESFRVIQYSWRLMGQLGWMGSLMCAFVLANNLNHRSFTLKAILLVVALIFSASVWLLHPMTKLDGLSIDSLNKLPTILNEELNVDMYVMNPKTSMSNFLIDNIALVQSSNTSINNQLLKLRNSIILSAAYLNVAAAPFIFLQGALLPTYKQPYPKLNALLDGKLVSSYQFKPGQFNWKIPFNKSNQNKANQSASIQFVGADAQSAKANIPIYKMLLGGFYQPIELVTLNSVVPYCHKLKARSVCDVPVGSSARLLELPLLYYPDMLDISVNHKKVNYKGILFQGDVITVIAPIPGKVNHIEFTFRGLLWANFVSYVCWMMLLLCGVFLVLNRKAKTLA
jgi:hypothetical protein